MNADGRWFEAMADDLRQVRGVPQILDATYQVFEVMLAVTRQHQDPGDGLFAAYVMAAASAADGRDAVARAPALPSVALADGNLVVHQEQEVSAAEAADGLAVLCEVLGGLLTDAGRAAVDPRDKATCAQAAGHAREIHALLVGA